MPINPGTYKAKIKDYGYSQKEGKDPSAMVQFQLEDGHTITWFGSFNGGARAITVKTLIETLGFSSDNPEDLYKGAGSFVLNEDREYDLVIEDNTWNGVTRPRIKYINVSGQTRTIEKLDASQTKVAIGGLNLKADFLAAKQTMPKKDEDLPF